ncbi:unnamed protein product [Owenia fusiformis]|uniref:Phospholipid scramblase n=1 Tax=Owenia fusiformis TaxID=6347 RepID=A0A8J1T4I1_OWEFU|nr:unnamed protein product [Owenia fusiformis]
MSDVVIEQPGLQGSPVGWIEQFADLEKVNVIQEYDTGANCFQSCQCCVPSWRHKTFKITDENEQEILKGEDETEGIFCCCSSVILGCFGCGPSLTYEFKDQLEQRVLKLTHPIRCCGRTIEMSGPDGNVLAAVNKTFSICSALDFDIVDNDGETVFNVSGPSCLSCECGGITYNVRKDDNDVGEILVSWDGPCGCCCCGCCDCAMWKFEIKFQRDMDVYQKLMMVGSVFLIEVMAERMREGI